MRYVRFALIVLFAATFATALKQQCVLTGLGRQECVPSRPVSSFDASLRMEAGAACDSSDAECLCVQAVRLTNQVRRKHMPGAPELKVGSVSQLRNAQSYAQQLAAMDELKHQPLERATREVACSRWIGAENIAFNYDVQHPAEMCLSQWEMSEGHLQNIVRDWPEEVVVGFYFAPDGRVYCVQTFGKIHEEGTFGEPDDQGCQAVTDFVDDVQQDDESEGDRPQLPEPSSVSPSPSVTPSAIPSATPAVAPSFAPSIAPSVAPSVSPSVPSPTPSMSPQMMWQTRQGNRSCRCLEMGLDCWHSLRRKSGYRCKPWTEPWAQPLDCKINCCQYCQRHPTNGRCTNHTVQALCEFLL